MEKWKNQIAKEDTMRGLLATAERLSGFAESFIDFFNNFKVMYAVEIVFFFLVIYIVSKI